MKKLKSIVLHMGPDKTGSTAIQKSFYANAQLFESLGVLYLSDRERGKNDKMLSVAFCENKERASKLFNADEHQWDTESKQYLNILQEKIATTAANTLVLSHEGLVHLNISEFNNLYDFLRPLAEDVHVVMYARPPIPYAISAMSQRVKTGRRILSRDIPVLKYRNYLECIVSVFGRENITVRLFDSTAFPSGNVVLDFLSMPVFKSLQQLDDETLGGTFKGNPGFSDAGLRLGDRIIGVLGSKTPTPKKFKKLFADDLYLLKGQSPTLSFHQRWVVKKLSARHTDFLRSEFDIFFPESTLTQSNKLSADLTSKKLEFLALDLIIRRLPNYKISWFRLIRRRILCLLSDTLPKFM